WPWVAAFFILPLPSPRRSFGLLCQHFNFLLLQGGGFPRLERSLIAVRCWMLDVRCSPTNPTQPAAGLHSALRFLLSAFYLLLSLRGLSFQVSSLIPDPAFCFCFGAL